MQNYTEIPSSSTLSDSLSQILNNDKTALSLSSGTSFPTVNLQQGMPCFRTDEQKLYVLTVVSPATWKMVIDLSATVGKVANADLLDGIDSTGFALSGHNHDAAYAALGHNHNSTYLGISAKAADADRLDGFDSTAFVRSVNGVGPDASGNSSIPIDLSSRVAKSGDTMSGTLAVPRLQILSTANYIDMVDQDWGTRYLHHNQGLMGFLRSDGSWDMYMNNSGSLWTCNYGWLPVVRFVGSHSAEVALTGEVAVSFKLETPDGKPIVDREADVYLDATAGYLAARRVTTVKGAGSATFRPDGMNSGDLAKVKVGFKLFTGTDDLVVSVT